MTLFVYDEIVFTKSYDEDYGEEENENGMEIPPPILPHPPPSPDPDPGGGGQGHDLFNLSGLLKGNDNKVF